MPYLTGDDAQSVVCASLIIPDDPNTIRALKGALLVLTDSSQWEKFGELTPEQAAEKGLIIYESLSIGDCP